MQKLPGVLVVSGFAILICSIVLGWIVLPEAIEKKILKKVRLENGTDTWENWRNLPIPVYFKIYMFNVTNPLEVENGEKPKLDELGPYVYQEKRYKINISVNETQDTVKYRQPVLYFFRQDMSTGTEDDVLTFLNIPMVGLSHKAPSMSMITRTGINLYLMRFKERLFIQRTIKQLLFGGYHHDMFAEVNKISGKNLLPNNTFGLMYGKNGSDDGEYEVYSGVKDSNLFGKVFSWNGKRNVEWWGGQYCNMINGSDGSLFAPFVRRDRILRLYNSDLCRSLHLTYDRDSEFKGIPTYRFTTPKELLEDPRINPDNLCFCPNPGKNHEGCLKAGAIQLSSCRDGAPVIASTPHFLDGAQEYVDSSIGLNPIRESHQTFVELEPTTGLVVQASKRVQINVDLKPTHAVVHFSKVPKMVFPIMWADEYAALTEEKAGDFRTKLLLPVMMINIGKLVSLGLSCLLICGGIIIFFLRMRRKTVFT